MEGGDRFMHWRTMIKSSLSFHRSARGAQTITSRTTGPSGPHLGLQFQISTFAFEDGVRNFPGQSSSKNTIRQKRRWLQTALKCSLVQSVRDLVDIDETGGWREALLGGRLSLASPISPTDQKHSLHQTTSNEVSIQSPLWCMVCIIKCNHYPPAILRSISMVQCKHVGTFILRLWPHQFIELRWIVGRHSDVNGGAVVLVILCNAW